jgi:hypothetical protein
MPIPDGYKPPKTGNASTYDPVPDDFYQFDIADVNVKSVDTWDEENKRFDPEKKKDVYEFTAIILNDSEFTGPLNGDQTTRGRRAWIKVNPFCSPATVKNGRAKSASSLYVLAKAVYGRELTPDECEAIGNNPTPLVAGQFKARATTKVGSTYINVNPATALRVGKKLPRYDAEAERPNAGRSSAESAPAERPAAEPGF